MRNLIFYFGISALSSLLYKRVRADTGSTIISQNVYILFKKDGNNFITQENENKIKLFVLDNNKEKELFNYGPKIGIGFNIIKRPNDGASVFLLYGDEGKSLKSDVKSYIIDFNDGSRDTLVLSFRKSKNSLICTSVKHRNKTVWETNSKYIDGMPWERSIIINKI